MLFVEVGVCSHELIASCCPHHLVLPSRYLFQSESNTYSTQNFLYSLLFPCLALWFFILFYFEGSHYILLFSSYIIHACMYIRYNFRALMISVRTEKHHILLFEEQNKPSNKRDVFLAHVMQDF